MATPAEATRRFVAHVRKQLRQHSVRLQFSTAEDAHVSYSGWFDDRAKELVVFRRNPRWLDCLLHEFSHFLQFIEKHPLFAKTTNLGQFWLEECALRRTADGQPSVCALVQNVSSSERNRVVEEILRDVQRLELDVAPKSVALAQEFGLAVNVPVMVACTLRNVAQWRYEVEAKHSIVPTEGLSFTQDDIDQATLKAFGDDYQHFDYTTLKPQHRQYFERFYS